jgi:putative SOS response-associated peptidase YedK
LNARAETIHKKPAFRHSISAKRCLVLVDGFYEWREFNKRRYPYYISMVDDGAFALAGIWDSWLDEKSGETKYTFSVITTDANPLLEKIHNTRKRMPVILEKADEKRWLRSDQEEADIDSMLKPYDDSQIRAHTVSRLISAKRVDSNTPEVMKPFLYPELEP